jgi:predicted acetyltransferase
VKILIEEVDITHLAQVREQQPSLKNRVMNVQDTYEADSFSTNSAPISYIIVLHISGTIYMAHT